MICKILSSLRLVVLILVALESGRTKAATTNVQTSAFVLETMPRLANGEYDDSWMRVSEIQVRAKSRAFGKVGIEQVIDEDNRWPTQAHTIITVAFDGGDSVLHSNIMSRANLWCNGVSVSFDSGYDKTKNTHRLWRRSDDPERPVAQVRIAFDDTNGHWSHIGRNATRIPKFGNKPTMNLSGFTNQLPSNWEYVVIHEFGHVLGLLHELSHPELECPLRWHNDKGYQYTEERGTATPDGKGLRPGVYTFFGSAPNGWKQEQTRRNIGIVPKGYNVSLTPFDRDSVMLYALPEWLFENPAKACLADKNVRPSKRDMEAVARMFPLTSNDIARASLMSRELKRAVLELEPQLITK